MSDFPHPAALCVHGAAVAMSDGEAMPEKKPRTTPLEAEDGSETLIAPGGKVDQQRLFELYEQQEGDDETPLSVRMVLARDLNKRLDKYLVDRIPFLSRTSLQRLVKEEAVHVNGRVPKASTRLRKGDEVVVVLPPPPSKEDRKSVV